MGSIRLLKSRGTLFLDFRYQGERCREYTALQDTSANRKRLEKALAKIEADIEAGTFDYEVAFPGSKRGTAPVASSTATASGSDGQVQAETNAAGAGTPTFKDAADQWMRERKVEWRRSHLQIQESTIEKHLIPAFGAKRVGAITKSDVLTFRATLAQLAGPGGSGCTQRSWCS